MADEIQPALTPDQWAAVQDERRHPENYDGQPIRPLTGITISYTDGSLPTGYALVNPFTPHQLIALLNDALSDDDERKITRRDVEMLRLLLGAFEPDDGVHGWLPALAAKLAALLPPNQPTYEDIVALERRIPPE